MDHSNSHLPQTRIYLTKEERVAKALAKAEDAAVAMSDHIAKVAARQANTEKLRALRLERDAEVIAIPSKRKRAAAKA